MVFNFETCLLIFAEGFILETGNHVTAGKVTRDLFFLSVIFVTQNVVHEITSDKIMKTFLLVSKTYFDMLGMHVLTAFSK